MAALQGIDLDVAEGMFGLLGPNGAVKSTFMRILAGLLEPTSGRISLDGEDVTSKPERAWGRLGSLPQEFGFYPHLTGEQANPEYRREVVALELGVGASRPVSMACAFEPERLVVDLDLKVLQLPRKQAEAEF